MTEGTYLDSILAYHRERAKNDPRSLNQLLEKVPAEQRNSPTFKEKILAEKDLSVIAEIKRRSPSKGELKGNLDAVALAQAYERAGAACISVLTDSEHFGGSKQDLINVKRSVEVPILRKDFTVDFRDVCDARMIGADCVLLIVAALEKKLLAEFIEFCEHLNLDALVEAHDEAEVEIALDAGAKMVGINQRDLRTFKVDQKRALRVVSEIPKHVVKVAESGIRSLSDAEPLKAAGFDAVLIGESLVKSNFPDQLIKQLRNL
tara:strand:+ start:2390 stop:3175 length:786 start_codon:yes stop_codon:yes gene_type:complete